MTESKQGPLGDDTEGHSHLIADAERDESEDTEGHAHRAADAEQDESDDTEGHLKAR